MRSKIRTLPIKGLLIFLPIVIISSIGMILLFAFTKQNLLMSILVYIFCGAFAALGLALLLDQLFHYTMIDDDVLINQIIFVRKKIKVEQITKIILKDEMYLIFVGKKQFAVISTRVRGGNEIILALERQGKSVK
jgi:hypothetical protein